MHERATASRGEAIVRLLADITRICPLKGPNQLRLISRLSVCIAVSLSNSCQFLDFRILNPKSLNLEF